MKQLVLAASLVLAAAACGAVKDTDGTLGGACRNGTCDPNLECKSDVCVAPSCPAGQTECGGMCTDTSQDPTNCHVCGNVCDGTNGTATCVSGTCTPVCNTGFGNCDTDPATGCTTALTADDNNCGFCGNKCVGGDRCKQGLCKPRNLLVIGDAGATYVPCVVAGLTPFFDVVTTVSGLPSAADLAATDAVLVFNNGSLMNAVGLGDALADFFDAKGHVVEALYGTGALGPLAGRWGTDNYRVLSGNYASTAVALGVIAEPTSPLMAGVTTLAATRSVTGTAVNGGIVVASYNNGTPLVVRGLKNGHARVDLGMFPGGCSGAYWTGDGFPLMRNALNF